MHGPTISPSTPSGSLIAWGIVSQHVIINYCLLVASLGREPGVARNIVIRGNHRQYYPHDHSDT